MEVIAEYMSDMWYRWKNGQRQAGQRENILSLTDKGNDKKDALQVFVKKFYII